MCIYCIHCDHLRKDIVIKRKIDALFGNGNEMSLLRVRKFFYGNAAVYLHAQATKHARESRQYAVNDILNLCIRGNVLMWLWVIIDMCGTQEFKKTLGKIVYRW